MPINIVVPDLGESVVEATVLRWLKQEGDPVAVGETVVELETDKVNLEVRAPSAGVLTRIEHKAGDEVKIGDMLGTIEPSAVATAAPPAAPAPSVLAPAPAKEKQSAPPAEPAKSNGEGGGKDVLKATPVAERMASEYGIDLHQVTTSASDGRITRQDIEKYMEQRNAAPSQPAPTEEKQTAATQPAVAEKPQAAPPAPRQATPSPSEPVKRNGREERVKMSRRRQTIARRLVEAQQTAAMLTTFNEIDMGAVMELRAQRKEAFKQRYGVGLGITSFFVKATIGALKAFPQLNAEIQGDEIVLKHYYDIGVAVGAAEGLVVPVMRDADRMSFVEIEKAIVDMAKKAENSTLSLEDLRGGTFTITNGGVFGSMLSTPILNPPQVGILGLHKIEDRPIAQQGQVVIRPMMYVALSYDHRIVDGREAVQFLVRIKELIQDPTALLLES
jgi:2-oxoglutarate dehydrogenase E2 component (dihydrolipoamide succinyltransferase)